MELEKLQTQLNTMLVKHQELRQKWFNGNKQDNVLKEELKNVQNQITYLSLQQKHILDKLRAIKTEDAVDSRDNNIEPKGNGCQTDFLSFLGLVTQDKFLEMKLKQQERKRRSRPSTPNYMVLLQMKDYESSEESSEQEELEETEIKRKRGRPSKQRLLPIKRRKRRKLDNSTNHALPLSSTLALSANGAGVTDFHEGFCTECHETGELLMCDTCDRVYHLHCLEPPLERVPPGTWFCPRCQERIENMKFPSLSDLSINEEETDNFRKQKEKEKQLQLEESLTLRRERDELDRRIKQLSTSIMTQIQAKKSAEENIEDLKKSVAKLKNFIRLVKQS